MSGEQLLYNRPLPGARLNMSHPLAKGLVGCWLLNEQMGLRAMDLSPYGNHGLLSGFPAGYKRPFNGLPFDGVDDQITISNSASLNPVTGITLAAWVYCRGTQGAHNEFISKGNNDATWEAPYGQYRFIYYSDINTFSLRLPVGGTAYVLASSASFTINTWHFAVGTYDNETMKIYVGGKLNTQDTTPSGDLNTYASTLRIGRLLSAAVSEEFDGPIGEVLIYNRALSAVEIQQLYFSPYNPMGLKMFI